MPGHLPAMKIRLMAAWMVGCTLAAGEEPKAPVKPTAPPKAKAVESAKTPKTDAKPKAAAEPSNEPKKITAPEKNPDVEDAIPDAVKALGEPAMVNFPNGIRMAVTAATEKAQAHVNQGMNHLHGGWEFEASRHFAAAVNHIDF